MLILTIHDSGDPDCGILPTSWDIMPPFEEISTENSEYKDFFLKDILVVYSDFAAGKLSYEWREQ